MNPAPFTSDDGLITGRLSLPPDDQGRPMVAFIHGGGCNGRYFELRKSSAVDAFLARGHPIFVLDRPGYGGNPVPPYPDPIAATAPLIRDFVADVRAEAELRTGVALVGHSIGGAIAITIAADPGRLPLRAIAVSGIGDRSPPRIRELELSPGAARVPPPPALTEGLFFDPDRALRWQAVASLRSAAEDWLVSEVQEVVLRWPEEWRERAARITVPVHLRLAEHERIWEADAATIARMAAAFVASPRVDAALLPAGGHLYEATEHGPALFESQLDFIAAAETASASR